MLYMGIFPVYYFFLGWMNIRFMYFHLVLRRIENE